MVRSIQPPPSTSLRVEYDRLAWRDRALRLRELHVRAPVPGVPAQSHALPCDDDGSARRRDRAGRSGARNPVHTRRGESRLLERLARAHDDRARRRIQGETYRGLDAERRRPLRCPTVKRWMPAWRPSTWPARSVMTPPAALWRVPRDEAGVVAVGHEADLLAVGLFRDQQSESRACARTSDFVIAPTGKRARDSCAWVE